MPAWSHVHTHSLQQHSPTHTEGNTTAPRLRCLRRLVLLLTTREMHLHTYRMHFHTPTFTGKHTRCCCTRTPHVKTHAPSHAYAAGTLEARALSSSSAASASSSLRALSSSSAQSASSSLSTCAKRCSSVCVTSALANVCCSLHAYSHLHMPRLLWQRLSILRACHPRARWLRRRRRLQHSTHAAHQHHTLQTPKGLHRCTCPPALLRCQVLPLAAGLPAATPPGSNTCASAAQQHHTIPNTKGNSLMHKPACSAALPALHMIPNTTRNAWMHMPACSAALPDAACGGRVGRGNTSR